MAEDQCRCRVVGSTRDPYEPHIPAQLEWEQADDCPVHPLLTTETTQPMSADHVRCALCGEVLHMLLMGHHDLTCPLRNPPGKRS